MDSEEARLTVRVPRELHVAAKAKAEAEDLTISQVVRWFLRAWVQDEISPILARSEPEEESTREP